MREYHRYTDYSQKRLIGDKQKIRIFGKKEDANKWYRCWNCGFPCSVDRDALGVDGGVTTEAYVDTDGITKYKPVVVSGCPNCGCSTWKG